MLKKLKPEDIKYLAVHCSATPPDMDIGRKEIDRWHRKRGWRMIGYHFVIRRDGHVEDGRPIDEIGAHVLGYNHESLGICLVGGINDKGEPEDNFTDHQMVELAAKLRELLLRSPGAKVQGHRDFPDVHKACPSFDVQQWIDETHALDEEYP